jgi:lysyl-tRNA synthetase class 2
MTTLADLRKVRIEKLEKLKKLGIDPYPAKSHKTHINKQIHDDFASLEGKEVVAAGRIISMREHVKLFFIDLKDASGKIQLYIKELNLSSVDHKKGELAFDELNLLDLGDFVEASGTVTKTQRGEISVEVKSLRILTKSLRSLPDQWDGFKNKKKIY